jgi:hypothetical protein
VRLEDKRWSMRVNKARRVVYDVDDDDDVVIIVVLSLTHSLSLSLLLAKINVRGQA